MALRVFIMLAVFAAMPAGVAREGQPRIDQRVHDGNVCWDPDVEFPVPCDDDDD